MSIAVQLVDLESSFSVSLGYELDLDFINTRIDLQFLHFPFARYSFCIFLSADFW